MADAGSWFWVPHPQDIWLPGRFQGNDEYDTPSGKIKCSDADRGVGISDMNELNGVDDCCTLDNVTSASILHTARVRYQRGDIYTSISDILIAVNPFKNLNIYGQEHVDLYSEEQDSAKLSPHIFGLCSRAFTGLFDTEVRTNQAILISGESGAGKTETTKFVLLYTSDRLSSAGQAGGIEDLLMEINPILEAFGNAKTVRNNNSSRFGKWIEVRVDPAARCIRGVSIIEYLLEVTRVCGQGSNERNYHIFYQLAKNGKTKESLKLDHAPSACYLKANGMEIEGVDDAQDFAALRKALTALDFSAEEEQQLFKVVGGILHIGNLEFKPGDCTEVTSMDELNTAAELLGVTAKELSQCVCKKRIVTAGETLMKDLDQGGATATRDSMAKLMYKYTFAWLVARCNEAIQTAIQARGILVDPDGDDQFLGVLDIAGFESFEKNLLEQLLINLSNEKLQQFFNNAVFRSEISEYTAEGLDIKTIEWADNTEVLQLIEGTGGILTSLDDATTGVRQTDEALVARLLKEKVKHPNFLKPKKFDPLVFGIKHYAGIVFYNAQGFLEKNISQSPPEVVELMANSSLAVLQQVAQQDQEGGGLKTAPTVTTINTGKTGATGMTGMTRASPRPGAGKKKAKATNAGAYKRSLQQLMDKLSTANCHFARCVKPNSEKKPNIFNAEMVMDQLRLAGVMETIEIRKAGFLFRKPYAEFNGRYITVMPKEERKKYKGADEKATSEAILKTLGAEAGQAAMGKTKVFLKMAIQRDLEAKRSAAFVPLAKTVQSAWRGYNIRKQMVEVKEIHKDLKEAIEACGHQLRVEPKGRHIERPTIAEGSLAKLDILLARAVNLPIRLGYINDATKQRARIAAETALVRNLSNLSLQLNIFEMEEALAQADNYQIQGPLVDKVSKRLQDVKMETPIKEALHAAFDLDELEGLQAAVSLATAKGLDKMSKWTMPSGASIMEKAMARKEELEEEKRRYEAFLAALNAEVEEHIISTDLQLCQQVLARAAAADIKNENIDKLAARCAALEIHLGLHRQLQTCVGMDSIADIEAIIKLAEEQGIRNDRWTLPSGAEDLAGAEARVEKLKAQAEAKALALKQAKDKLRSELKAGHEAVEFKYVQDLVQRGEQEFPEARREEFGDELELLQSLRQRIENMKAEMEIIDKLQGAINSFQNKEDFEPLRKECHEQLLADNKDGWILKEGFSAWTEMEHKYNAFLEKETCLKELAAASAEMAVKKIEAGLAKATELGIDDDALKSHNQLVGKLQNTNHVRDLMLKHKSNEMAYSNLKTQLDEIQAREDGGHSVIEMQLQRLVNGNNTDQMREVLRKAERAEFRGDILDDVRERCITLERQQPMLAKLQQAFWHGNYDELKEAISAFRESEGPTGMSRTEEWPCEGLLQFYNNACRKLQTLEEEREGAGTDDKSVLQKLQQLRICTNANELSDALKLAQQAKIQEPVVDELIARLKTLEKQQGYLAMMRDCLPSRDLEKVQKVLDEMIVEGLNNQANWLLDEGPSAFYMLTGYLKELEASQQKAEDAGCVVRSQLRELATSTDVTQIRNALAQAKAANVTSELVSKLTERADNLQKQGGLLKELKGVLRSTDAEELQGIVIKVRKAGLDNIYSWVCPEGPRVFSKVITRKIFCEQLEDIESRVKKAMRVYNVKELEACFREAEHIGVPPKFEKLTEAKALLLRLQSSEMVEKLVQELRTKASHDDSVDVAEVNGGITFLMQHLMQMGLMLDNSALQDVAESMAHSKHVKRRRHTAGGRERVDSVHATAEAAANLRAMLVEDLSNYKQLRDPLTWETEGFASTKPEERRHAMVSHQSEKLTQSLTVMKPYNEKIALQNFIDLLRCMGDKPSTYRGDKKEPILKRLQLNRCICDEVYMQVMKQLSNNPSSESTSLGWELMKELVQEALPSPDVYLFLRAFIKRQSHQPKAVAGKGGVAASASNGGTGGPKKDWRQTLLGQVREDIRKTRKVEDEGFEAVVSRMRARRRRTRTHSAAEYELRRDSDEREMEVARQSTLASECFDLLPDDEEDDTDT